MNKKIYLVGSIDLWALTCLGLFLLILDYDIFAGVIVLHEAGVIKMYAACLLVPIMAAAVWFFARKYVCNPVLTSDEEYIVSDNESERIKLEATIKRGRLTLFMILLLATIVINFFAVRRIGVFSTVIGDSTAYVKEEDHWVEYQRDGLVLNINDRAGYAEDLLTANLDSVDEDDLKSVADNYTIVISDYKVAQHTWETTHGLSNTIYYAYVDGDTLYCAGGGLIADYITWAAEK